LPLDEERIASRKNVPEYGGSGWSCSQLRNRFAILLQIGESCGYGLAILVSHGEIEFSVPACRGLGLSRADGDAREGNERQ